MCKDRNWEGNINSHLLLCIKFEKKVYTPWLASRTDFKASSTFFGSLQSAPSKAGSTLLFSIYSGSATIDYVFKSSQAFSIPFPSNLSGTASLSLFKIYKSFLLLKNLRISLINSRIYLRKSLFNSHFKSESTVQSYRRSKLIIQYFKSVDSSQTNFLRAFLFHFKGNYSIYSLLQVGSLGLQRGPQVFV